MKYNSDQVINGIMSYADKEVINKLPTMGKWILGTGIGMVSDRVNGTVSDLQNNSMLKMMGIVDDDGNFDIDTLAMHLRDSANKYGKAYFEIPLLGKMTFTADDIEILRQYIEMS